MSSFSTLLKCHIYIYIIKCNQYIVLAFSTVDSKAEMILLPRLVSFMKKKNLKNLLLLYFIFNQIDLI